MLARQEAARRHNEETILNTENAVKYKNGDGTTSGRGIANRGYRNNRSRAGFGQDAIPRQNGFTGILH